MNISERRGFPRFSVELEMVFKLYGSNRRSLHRFGWRRGALTAHGRRGRRPSIFKPYREINSLVFQNAAGFARGSLLCCNVTDSLSSTRERTGGALVAPRCEVGSQPTTRTEADSGRACPAVAGIHFLPCRAAACRRAAPTSIPVIASRSKSRSHTRCARKVRPYTNHPDLSLVADQGQP